MQENDGQLLVIVEFSEKTLGIYNSIRAVNPKIAGNIKRFKSHLEDYFPFSNHCGTCREGQNGCAGKVAVEGWVPFAIEDAKGLVGFEGLYRRERNPKGFEYFHVYVYSLYIKSLLLDDEPPR